MLYNGNAMSKRQLLIIIGIWIAAFLFLGFPSGLDKILAIATGAVIIIIAYKLEHEAYPSTSADVPYVEHKSPDDPVIPQ